MKPAMIFAVLFAVSANAQPAAPGSVPAKSVALTLEQYLEQVKTQNPEARSVREQLQKAQLRLDEAEVPLSSELYAKYNFLDNRDEATSGFAPGRVNNRSWRVGVKDPTQYGLSTDIYVESAHNTLYGLNPAFGMMSEYEDSRAGIDIRQNLWRNGFGESTRAELEMRRAGSRAELLKRQFELKNLLLKAENAYWTLVSYTQIVRLQEENVGRARKLVEWMNKRVENRLVDDVEGLQTQASLETRELELQTSLDERAVVARQFNMLRGSGSVDVEALAELPHPKAILQGVNDQKQRMTREDFRIIAEQAEMQRLEAKGARSMIAPQLDLTAGVATNGLDPQRSRSFEEMQDMRNPTWSVGLMFSIPLDYSLIGNMRRSYKAADNAAAALKEHADYAEERTWNDLMMQKNESQRRFERALNLEVTQTDLVKRERQRLLNGRTTTFQAITFEQNLAAAQIQRVRSQVGLIQIHNVLKNWEVQP